MVQDRSLGQHGADLAMGRMPSLQDLVNHYAPQYGVDPWAALKVSNVEGGGRFGAVGDQGTSFGPWQLHIGGAMPSQYGTPGSAAAFANSVEGVKYALSRMGNVAGGLKGPAAVAAIVRGFERPADPSGEIQRALGSTGAAGASFVPAGGAMPTAPGAPPGMKYTFGTGGYAPFGSASAPGMNTQGIAASLRSNLSSLMNPSGQADPAQAILDATVGRQQDILNQFQQVQQLQQQTQSVYGPSVYGVQGQPQSNVPGAASNGIVKTAMTQLGIPYQWGGAAKLGGHTDCSGLVQAVYGANGISVPRTTYQQWAAGTPVDPHNMQPGDLVFFDMTKAGPGHVGIYVGGNKFIEDPHTGAAVRTSTLSSYPGFVGARRF